MSRAEHVVYHMNVTERLFQTVKKRKSMAMKDYHPLEKISNFHEIDSSHSILIKY